MNIKELNPRETCMYLGIEESNDVVQWIEKEIEEEILYGIEIFWARN